MKCILLTYCLLNYFRGLFFILKLKHRKNCWTCLFIEVQKNLQTDRIVFFFCLETYVMCIQWSDIICIKFKLNLSRERDEQLRNFFFRVIHCKGEFIVNKTRIELYLNLLAIFPTNENNLITEKRMGWKKKRQPFETNRFRSGVNQARMIRLQESPHMAF